MEQRPFVYQRHHHFRDFLVCLQANEPRTIPPEVIVAVRNRTGHFSTENVRHALRSSGHARYLSNTQLVIRMITGVVPYQFTAVQQAHFVELYRILYRTFAEIYPERPVCLAYEVLVLKFGQMQARLTGDPTWIHPLFAALPVSADREELWTVYCEKMEWVQ